VNSVTVPDDDNKYELVRWELDTAPRPILIVEVLSPTTRRRDRGPKRELYVDAAIPDYWLVDAEARSITVVRPGSDDVTVSEAFVWHPAAASDGLHR